MAARVNRSECAVGARDTGGATLRILVLGADGYLGWPSALHLSRQGHDVGVVDNFCRRQYDYEMGVESLVPIRPSAAEGADMVRGVGQGPRRYSSAT